MHGAPINNPGLPGAKLHKPLYDIKGYYWYGHGCNNRFLEALSEVDSSQFSETSTKYTETLITEKGKRIAAPDLRQKKQLALVAALLKCRYSSEWFRVKDLMPCLSGKLQKSGTNYRNGRNEGLWKRDKVLIITELQERVTFGYMFLIARLDIS